MGPLSIEAFSVTITKISSKYLYALGIALRQAALPCLDKAELRLFAVRLVLALHALAVEEGVSSDTERKLLVFTLLIRLASAPDIGHAPFVDAFVHRVLTAEVEFSAAVHAVLGTAVEVVWIAGFGRTSAAAGLRGAGESL